MLSPKVQYSLANAREYFRTHLSVGDYYAAGERIDGKWFGQGAEKLSLKGTVAEREFLALCEGRHPATGKRLTLRLNSTRHEKGRAIANRRIFYDFTLSPPKSVSVVGLYQDSRVVELHDRAVRLAMVELERYAETRIRQSGQNGERVTGCVVGASFQHDTSRELDPHLHTHCLIFNATFDPVEQRWKALHATGLYRAQKFAEHYYYHELCQGLRSLGYEMQSNARDFELKNVPASVIERFSKRHRQIEEEAHLRVAQGFKGNVKDLRERVAHGNRRRKLKDSTAGRLRPFWERQLTPEERRALASLRPNAPPHAPRADVGALVTWAEQHLFERRAVVNDYELLAAALARGRGEAFGLEALRTAIEQRNYVREAGTTRLTSRELLRCELDIVMSARDGRRCHGALNPGYRPSEMLAPEQKVAVEKILGSRDFITLFRGGAGTGKSYAIKEVARGLADANRSVVVLAPQRQQVGGLQADGLPAETLSHRLQSNELPPGCVVILDEAGQVGGRELHQLVRLVQASRGRLILSGDTRQHGAVTASDALRAIEKHSGLQPAEVRDIRRQNPALAASREERRFIRSYRAAVKSAAAGKSMEAFDRLEQLGCVRELPPSARHETLADEYVTALGRKESALIVAPTWAEVHAVNDAVRDRLRAGGRLGKAVRVQAYQATNWTEAEKRDPAHHAPGQFAWFHRSYGRFAKGDLCEIVTATERGLVLMKNGRRSTVGFKHTNRLTVARQKEMGIAAGDRLQLKFNGRSVEGMPLHNGEFVTVRRVRKDGAIVVTDAAGGKKTLGPAQRLFVHGYAVTAYASQGKTVDTVLVADDGQRCATNARQWYVTISRGRKRVVVFTSDRSALRANIEQAGTPALALDLNPAAHAPAPALEQSPLRTMTHLQNHRHHEVIMQRITDAQQSMGVRV